MCRVGCSTRMSSAGRSCWGKDAKMSIFSVVVVTSLSCRSNISGYAAKESVLCCWLHTSAKVATWCNGMLVWMLSLVNGWVPAVV